MFFILSKVLYFLTQPINWIVGACLYSIFGRQPKWKKWSLYLATFLVVFFTNHLIFNVVTRAWEPETLTADEIQEPYDIAILLGGFSNFKIEPADDRYNFSERGNRFTQTLELYFKGKVKKILVTGGSGAMLSDEPSEANEIHDLMIQFGVQAEDIIIENKSRNTQENAAFTRQTLREEHPNSRCLLITSAFHMRRAEACFAKENIICTPYVVDYMSERNRFHPEMILIPNSHDLFRWGVLIKEWIGYVAYWMRGYI